MGNTHVVDNMSVPQFVNLVQSVGIISDVGIDATLIKYSGTDSAAKLREYSNHLSAISTANGYVDKLGSTLISYSGAVNSVGLGALVISFMLDLAIRSAETDSGDTLNMLRRVFAEEKASDVRDSMYEYMKRLGMHLRDPVRALEDTERLEKQLSGQLTRLRNSMLHDNQMSSRSMKHWVNGAAFHSQMLVHAARLKTTSTNSDFDVYLNSVSAAVDMYRNDLRDLLNKYKDYKWATITYEKVKCLVCSQQLSYNNNTSSMPRHFRAKHENITCQSQAALSSSQGPRQKMIDKALVNMIVKDSQPFTIVDDAGFREFIGILDPTYILPSRKALKGMVESKYEEAKEKAKDEVHKAEAVSLTADMWTSIHMDAYLAITGHFNNEKEELSTVLLGVRKFPKTHSAENLAEVKTAVMAEWGVQKKVRCLVTDAAPNIVACAGILKMRHTVCIAHALNLVVQKAIDQTPGFEDIRSKARKIALYFRSSTTAKERLFQVQEQMGRSTLKLIQEVETRWNSTFAMLQRLYQEREPVGAALVTLKTDLTPLTSEEYHTINECLGVLSTFHEATTELSEERRVSGSKVIPLVRMTCC
ncbi:E3 SUMO-protein ligase ZBED1-like [Brachyhypopomus gauderio]|uniref:E3 SUMO-protein ligase ZBED1-like n=1 Tax=Brachyhypopomus gauderio TaxID=698409 RepID=UPI0040420F39